MVKRTAVVLSIMSLLVAGGASAALAWCGDATPLYVGVPCGPITKWTTITKKWEGMFCQPYMPTPGCMGRGCGHRWGAEAPGLFGGLAAAIATPMDVIFGGFDGVYGCGMGAFGGHDGPCGPFWGPIPSLLGGLGRFLSAPTTVMPELY